LLLAGCGAKPPPVEEIPEQSEPTTGPNAPSEPRPLEPGAAAPEFALTDADGSTHTLSEFRANGPVVIVFYQGSWCGGCRDQLKRFENKHAAFVSAGARVIAISADGNDKSKRLVDTLHLTFPVLSD